MRINVTRNFKKIVLILFFILLSQSFLLTNAQEGGVGTGETVTTNPKTRNNTVTAHVSDITSPSTPFLIAPEDDSLIRDATPTFIWQQSTDNIGIDHYALYIDGNLKYESIPTSSTSDSQYTLTYNESAGTYSLVPVSIISDGSHTWYIKVYDASGNTTTSATWDFTIDTNAPNFIIKTIGPLITTISAQDIESVPEETINFEDNQLEFTGTGEANADVQLTIQIPRENNQISTFLVNSNGTWNFQLGILPRNEIIVLNFVITDPAGNISVITNLKILIIQEYITIPPTQVATPIPTATIIINSGSSGPAETIPNLEVPTSPIIQIPLLPPDEIAEIIKESVLETIPKPTLEAVSVISQGIRQIIQKIIKNIAPIGVLLVTVIFPVLNLIVLLSQFIQNFSWDILLKILQALGLLPRKEPQGMVFDSRTNEPIPFALLTITSNNDFGEKLIETAVTDTSGIYQGIYLPIGKYNITVGKQEYTFPTLRERPRYLSIQEFYKGEEFVVSSEKNQQFFLIPIDKNNETQYKLSIGKTVKDIINKVGFLNLFLPLFIISILISLFYPTWINLLMLGFYVFITIKRFIKSLRKPSLSGFVITTLNEPVQNAIIRISDPTKGNLVSIINTNASGYYELFLKPDKYQIQITKNDLIWERTDSQLSFEEVDITDERKTVNAVMKDTHEVYKELFGELS